MVAVADFEIQAVVAARNAAAAPQALAGVHAAACAHVDAGKAGVDA